MMRFQWDDNKEKINISKHGLSFRVAATVFNDDDRLEIFDQEHSTAEEERYITIGRIEGTVVVIMVVHTERDDMIRIISARYATAEEERWYYDGIG
jgi:uncharacterized DUF497 family protein